MFAYHEITPPSLNSVLRDGLKRRSRGEKGDDSAIAQTDKYLDIHRPDVLRAANVSRDNNLYAYLAHKDMIIDITDGSYMPLDKFIRESQQVVLRLALDVTRCYVSDLDSYDTVKQAIENDHPNQILEQLATEYWQCVTPLASYREEAIRRPELMITYDIAADQITSLDSSS